MTDNNDRSALIDKIRALLSMTVENGCTEAEADTAFYKAKFMIDENNVTEDELRGCVLSDVPDDEDEFGSDIDGDAALNSVRAFLERFVSYPSRHAVIAHALWIAHTHMMGVWDSTPRIAFMSPERMSGKTRALEAMEFLVPRPIHSVNNSVAYVIRKISDENGAPTILQDEVDSLFGVGRASPEVALLLAIYNAGHRKGATAGRVIVGQGKPRPEELPAYCALAVAGLKSLPDTLGSRAIFIEMRRRAPDEKVEPFRERIHREQADPIRRQLFAWCSYLSKKIVGKYPELPAEITDRDADCWEPLLAIADAAGGDWPKLAREAAIFLVGRGKEQTQTDGVELLEHIRDAFMQAEKIWTSTLLERLISRDESPWADMGWGKALTDRGLAQMLKPYGVKSKQMKLNGLNFKGYDRADFVNAWKSYLPETSDTKDTRDTNLNNKNKKVSEVSPVAPVSGSNGKEPPSQETDADGIYERLVRNMDALKNQEEESEYDS